jgi:hypothetical protein
MNTIERFHIYQETKLNNQINDRYAVTKLNQINDRYAVQPNTIFEALVLTHSDKGH